MKVLLSIMLLLAFVVSGCGNDKDKESDNSGKNSTENVSENNKASEMKNIKNVTVSKDEMDIFIPTAKYLKLDEKYVRLLVEVLKSSGAEINHLSVDGAQEPMYYRNSNTVSDVNLKPPYDKKYLRNLRIKVSTGKGGFSVRLYDMITDKNYGIFFEPEGNISDISMIKEPTDELYNTVYTNIMNDTRNGEVVKVLVDGKPLKEKLKDCLTYTIDEQGHIGLRITVDKIVKSKVYGGDNERKYVGYVFDTKGNILENNPVTDKYENDVMRELEELKNRR